MMRLAPLLVVTLLCPALAAGPAIAQNSMAKSFGGLSGNSNEPIDIEADTLEVDDQKKVAIFKGDVKAKQGGMTLQSVELEVHYAGEGAGALAKSAEAEKVAEKPGDSKQKAQIKEIHARGKVLLSTDKNQSATSDWAIFNVEAQTVTIGGNVVLSQGENVIRGDRLVVDLKTGQSKFDTGVASGGGRVKGLFMPNQGKGAENGGGKGAASPEKEKAGGSAPASGVVPGAGGWQPAQDGGEAALDLSPPSN